MGTPATGFLPTFVQPQTSVAFGTAIRSTIQPKKNKRIKVTYVVYSDTGTAHTITFMSPLAKTRTTAAIALAGTSMTVARDPGAYAANAVADGRPVPGVADNLIAANDYVAYRQADGVVATSIVSSVVNNADGTVTFTIAAAAAAVVAGADVWFLGIPTDSNPRTGVAHPARTSGAATGVTAFGAIGEVVAQTPGSGEPMMVNSNNATATGTLNEVSGVYAMN